MPGKPARFIALPLVLLGFITIGCQKQLVPEGPNCPGDAVIKVKKDGHVNKEKVKLDKRCKDVAFWVAEESDKGLLIEFDVRIFEGMTQEGNRWRVHCEGRACFSGDIREDTEGNDKEYKYYQILVNPQDSADKKEVDGWIVIRP